MPLSDDALAIFASLPRFKGDLIFTTTNGKTPINGLSKSKRRLDRLMLSSLKALARLSGENPAAVTLPDFINHDLRRVLRSNLSALDIENHVAEMCLGHGRKGLQRVYDQHKYLPQQREALKNGPLGFAKSCHRHRPRRRPQTTSLPCRSSERSAREIRAPYRRAFPSLTKSPPPS